MKAKFWAILCVLFICLSLVSGVFAAPLPSGGDSALDTSPYLRTILLDNPSSQSITGFQANLTIDSASLIAAGKMRPDMGDLRFWDSNGNPIPYWVESGAGTTSTVVWFRVPSIPANGSASVTMTYGDLSLTSLSDGEATFDFFDDFSGQSLDTEKWTVSGNSPEIITLSYGVLHFSAQESGESAYITPKNLTLNRPFVVDVRSRINGANRSFESLRFRDASGDNAWALTYDTVYAWGVHTKINQGWFIYYPDMHKEADAPNQYKIQTVGLTSSNQFYAMVSPDRFSAYKTVTRASYFTPVAVYDLGVRNLNGPAVLDVDWYLVRKYPPAGLRWELGAEQQRAVGEYEYPQNGLVLYQPFDSAPFQDASGNGLNAACSGGNCPTVVEGMKGGAARFDGNDCLTIPNSSLINFNIHQDYTFSLWIKADATQNALPASILEKWNGGGAYPYVMRLSTGPIFYFKTDPGDKSVTADVTYGEWHHYAVVNEGTQRRMYLDGKLVHSNTVAGSYSVQNGAPLYVGCRNGSFNFRGEMDELAVYNRALSETEVQGMTLGRYQPPIQVAFLSLNGSTPEKGIRRVYVGLDRAASEEVTVEYYTSGGTAIAGEDYAYDMNGTLTFSPGETLKSFSIPIRNDIDLEGNETVLLNLRNPQGAVLDATRATLTILDNESEKGFSVDEVIEGGELAVTYTPDPAAPAQSISIEVQLPEGAGNTAVTLSVQPSESAPEPGGFSLLDTVYEISLKDVDETEDIEIERAQICFPYSDEQVAQLGVAETDLKLLHYENGEWVDITQSVDTANNRICGLASSFSPFAIVGESGEIIGSGDTGDVTVIVEGASLAVHPDAVDFGALALDGYSHDLSASPASPWIAIDPTGTGAGWHLALNASDFLNGAGQSISVANLSISFSEVSKLAGNEPPASQVSQPLTLSGADQTILLAEAGTGMGSYQFTPAFGLFVPANTYAGSYTATLTATIVAGP